MSNDTVVLVLAIVAGALCIVSLLERVGWRLVPVAVILLAVAVVIRGG